MRFNILFLACQLLCCLMIACSTNRSDPAQEENKPAELTRAEISQVNDLGQNLLHKAVLENDIELLKTVIAKGVDLNGRDKSGNTALHYALRNKNREALKILIDRGAVHASVSKAMTSIIFLQLLKEGAIKNLDDDIAAYSAKYRHVLPAAFVNEKITFRHILTHTSGIPHIDKPLWLNGKPRSHLVIKPKKKIALVLMGEAKTRDSDIWFLNLAPILTDIVEGKAGCGALPAAEALRGVPSGG